MMAHRYVRMSNTALNVDMGSIIHYHRNINVEMQNSKNTQNDVE